MHGFGEGSSSGQRLRLLAGVGEIVPPAHDMTCMTATAPCVFDGSRASNTPLDWPLRSGIRSVDAQRYGILEASKLTNAILIILAGIPTGQSFTHQALSRTLRLK